MKKLFLFILMCVLSNYTVAQKTIEYCANIGPVRLIFDKDSVKGSYLITVTKQPVKGIIKGRIQNGLLDAIWIDTEGTGRILFGFSSDKNEFNGFYNTAGNPSHWIGSWRASNKITMKNLPADRQKGLRCEWIQAK